MKVVAFLGALAFAALVSGSTIFAEEQPAAQLHEHPTLRKMLARSNELRRQVGLRPHRMSPELTKAAQDQANYMAQTGSFSHYSNGGPWGRALRHRFFGGGVLENIAMGQGGVGHVFNTWQNSGGHWASIVSNTTDAGFGYAIGPGGSPYWVAVYGNAANPVAKATAEEPAKEGTTQAKPAAVEATAVAPTYSTGSSSRGRLLFRRR